MRKLLLFYCFFLHVALLTGQQIQVSDIWLEGNKTTRDHVVMREIVFAPGDSIPLNQLEDKLLISRQNLLNTSLFNFVNVIVDTLFPGKVEVTFELAERWYLWPIPVFEIAEPNLNIWLQTWDFSRTNYGLFVTKENFRGRRERIRLKAQFGFTEELALEYYIPYINKNQKTGLAFAAGYSRNHEVLYKTLNNDRVYYKNDDRYIRHQGYGSIGFIYRPKWRTTSYFELGYLHNEIQDTLFNLSPDYFPKQTNKLDFFSLKFVYRRDRRDLKAYPLKGHFVGVIFKKYGLGIFQNNLNSFEISAKVNAHWQLYNRWYYALSAKAKFTLPQPLPYCVQRGLGYNDLVRGYELYVIDGQHFGLLKTNLKFQLIKYKTVKMNFIPTEKFNTFHYQLFANAFVDAGYVHDQLYAFNNALSNTLLVGYGVGLDFVTYYDIVLRGEFALNIKNDYGFYFHLVKSF